MKTSNIIPTVHPHLDASHSLGANEDPIRDREKLTEAGLIPINRGAVVDLARHRTNWLITAGLGYLSNPAFARSCRG